MSKFLKKAVIVLALAFAIFPITSHQVYAANELPACACSTPTKNSILNNCKMSDGTLGFCDNGEKGEGVFYILQIVVDIMAGLVGILGVIGITVCGVVILTSKGDPARMTKGKTRLREVLIGLGLFLCLWGIIKFLLPSATGSQSNVNYDNMNVADPERPVINTNTNTNTGTNTGTPAHTSNGWNMSCGPDPNQSINKSKYGEKTTIYRNSFGRTFYTFKQGDPVWTSMQAGKNGEGTMGGRGCFRTSMAVMFNSFGMSNFTPANLSTYGELGSMWAAVQKYPEYKNYFSYQALSSVPKSEWKTKIINAFKEGGAIIVRAEGGYFPSSPTSNHSMPFIDYRVQNGKDQVYTANTGNNSKAGWYDIDTLVNNVEVKGSGLKSSVAEIILVKPKNKNLNCSSYR